jgi:hypothetical protein
MGLLELPELLESEIRRLLYPELFDYFTRLFYNFLCDVNQTEDVDAACATVRELAELVLQGPDASIPEIHMTPLSRPTPRFATYRQLTKHKIKLGDFASIAQDRATIRRLLKASEERLAAEEQIARELHNPTSIRKISQALVQVRSSERNLPNPPFLVPNFIAITVFIGNPQIGPEEVHITLLRVADYHGNLPGKLVIEFPGLEAAALPFDEVPLRLPVVRQLMKFSTKVASQFTKGHATVSFDGGKAESVSITLAPLTDRATFLFDLTVAEAKVTLEIAVRSPLTGKANQMKLIEYHCSPLLIHDIIAPSAAPAAPAGTRTTTRPPGATAQPSTTFRQIRILPKEERERFWGPGVITDYFIKIGRVSLVSYRTRHIPTAELEEQVAYFERRSAELQEEFEKDDFDQDAFLNQIRESIARELRLCAAAPRELRDELQKRIMVMQSELQSLEEQLAAGEE